MRKLFLFLVMMSLILGFGAMVIAGNTQLVSIGISSDTTLNVDPTSISFGTNLIPGETSNVYNSTLIPGTSNLVVSVSVSNDTTNLFQKIMIDSGTGFNPIGTETIGVTASKNKTIGLQLTVPVGFKSGPYSETLTYTVNSAD